jgi:hypothetical protein
LAHVGMRTAGLELSAARIVLGSLTTDALPEAAAQALAAGLDSPSLRVLAASSTRLEPDLLDNFKKALSELGVSFPSREQAGLLLARNIAERVLAGSIRPYEGAKAIWALYASFPKPKSLIQFVGLASEWEDHPSARIEIEKEIVEICRSFATIDPYSIQTTPESPKTNFE